MVEPTYVCDGCGACCKCLIVAADGDDVVREPKIAERCTRYLDSWGWQLTPHTDKDKVILRCPFLDDANRCRIYPTRPACCVGLQAGSQQCQDARRTAKLPPLEPSETPGNVHPEIVAYQNASRKWQDEELNGG